MVAPRKMPFDPQDDVNEFKDLLKDVPAAGIPKAASARKAPTRSAPTVSMTDIQESLENMYVLAGGMASAYPNPRVAFIGSALSDNAERAARSIVEAAEKDPKLKRALTKMMTAGAYTGIVMAHMPILMAVYMAVTAPPEVFGIAPTVEAEPEPESDTPPLFRTG
jgi:hypothetical protein